jgi:hypothetical protein
VRPGAIWAAVVETGLNKRWKWEYRDQVGKFPTSTDGQPAKRTDRMIADHVGVSNVMVSKYRELLTVNSSPDPDGEPAQEPPSPWIQTAQRKLGRLVRDRSPASLFGSGPAGLDRQAPLPDLLKRWNLIHAGLRPATTLAPLRCQMEMVAIRTLEDRHGPHDTHDQSITARIEKAAPCEKN